MNVYLGTTYQNDKHIAINKVEKCFGQSGHLFTNQSFNQINEKTIDLEDSTQQLKCPENGGKTRKLWQK